MDTTTRKAPANIIDKIWAQHVVADLGGGACVLHIDRLMLHDRGGGLVLRKLSDAGTPVARPESVFATVDHVVETKPGRTDRTSVPGGATFIGELRAGARRHALRLFDVNDPGQGIVHVISPETGIALPGMTLSCNDSHTCTVGGVGALGWGVGTTELEYALATGCVLMETPRPMRIELTGSAPAGTTAKDLVLHLIGVVGADGARGYAVELAGNVVRCMSIEERLTICNMAVEFGARTAIVAPDDTTFEFLSGTQHAPTGAAWDQALSQWRALSSDPGAPYAAALSVACDSVAPQITWGTSPAQVVSVHGRVPAPEGVRADDIDRALRYMGLSPGQPVLGIPIDVAFIGSCTNSRLSDLRAAAAVLHGRTVAPGVQAICVPGSQEVKRRAELEGLAEVFVAAGFAWREPGCSMCFYAGGEGFGGRRVITTTNRNFEHRQGPATRSHLASPATVAASAVAGAITDPRAL
ncbi:3-isopropylmalate dehydratase large subunit [Nocardia sp. NBC_00881]|uniref:3-isopropylmalate dehydratase large subunit n=1 Tax=Nocardia sp. NBC_00881 TaxID=2975995 RepID=UPI00386AA941|nr:3-isopropylmalate dehydratase large subunit [Nocardia sp. NBC_00881]